MSGLSGLLLRLSEGGVDFVLVGGYAALSLGGSMATLDVDIACDMESANLLKVFDACVDLHPVHRMTPNRLSFTRESAEKGGLKNLYLATDWGQLDCLGEVKGIGDYLQCRAQSEVLDFGYMKARVLTLEALIRAKRAIGRPRDLSAVMELEAIRQKRQTAE